MPSTVVHVDWRVKFVQWYIVRLNYLENTAWSLLLLNVESILLHGLSFLGNAWQGLQYYSPGSFIVSVSTTYVYICSYSAEIYMSLRTSLHSYSVYIRM